MLSGMVPLCEEENSSQELPGCLFCFTKFTVSMFPSLTWGIPKSPQLGYLPCPAGVQAEGLCRQHVLPGHCIDC